MTATAEQTAEQIRTAPTRATAAAIVAQLRGRRLAAVAAALDIHLYGTAADRRDLVLLWGWQRARDSRAISTPRAARW